MKLKLEFFSGMLFIIYGTPILTLSQICLGKYISWDLPGGAVDRSLPVNAGDPPLIPGPVRPHMPPSK